MNLRSKISKLLPAPTYQAKLISGWQNTGDIVKAIQVQHIENLQQAKKISHLFCGDNERSTARNIFDFLKTEIEYRVEPSTKQTTKSLQRFIADGYGDCKHFALFANTILQSCGHKPYYRFAGYKDKTNVQHVYTYLPTSNTILDAVLPSFDSEKTPTIKKDYNMSLYKLSGVDNEIGKISFDTIKKNISSAAAKSSNTVKKAAEQIPAAAQKLAQGAKTVSLTVPRAAFMALVGLNVHGLAKSLKALTDKKGTNDGLKWWYDLGGDRSALQDLINKHYQKKAIFGPQEELDSRRALFDGYSGDGDGIGEPVTIAASLATAAPILIKVASVLKENGINLDEVTKISNVAKKASSDFKNITGSELTSVIFKKDAGASSSKKLLKPSDMQPTTTEDATKVVTAAVAQSTGVDSKTITEIKDQVEYDVYNPNVTTPTLKDTIIPAMNKNAIWIGLGLLAAFLAFKN